MKRLARGPLVVACVLAVGVAAGRWAGVTPVLGQSAASPAVHEPTSFRDVVKKVLPAVVSVESKAKPEPRRTGAQNNPRRRVVPRLDDQQLPEDFRKFFEEFQRRQEDEGGPSEQFLGFGSGFIVDPKGIVLTNNHVVDGATEVEVTLHDGRKFVSKDIKTDEKTDLAIVRLDTKGTSLPYLELGDSSAMEIGDRVLAVGAPFGLTGTVTSGIISAKGRYGLGLNKYEDFLQTDAAINPGNSGGPLVNLDGKVIGVNSAIKSRSGGFQGVGLAISSNEAKSVMQQLIQNGVVKRGYLGVFMTEQVTPEVASQLGLKEPAVVVARVVPNSPAAKAGLKPDDAIVAVNGKPVKENYDLVRTVATLPLNQPVDVDVVRDGKPMKLKLTVQEEPKDINQRAWVPSRRTPRDTGSVTVEKAGLELADLSPEQAEQLGTDVNGGAVIVRVERDSVAADAGLRRGMVILKVNRKAVANAEAARDAIEKGGNKVLLHVTSPTGAGTALVDLNFEKK
jgi:serine protease Do